METIKVGEMTEIFFPSHGILPVRKLQERSVASKLSRVVRLHLFAFKA